MRVWVLGCGIAAALGFAACGASTRATSTPTTSTQPNTVPQHKTATQTRTVTTPAPPATNTTPPSNSGAGTSSYDPATEASFMSECDIRSGGKEGACRCALTYLEMHYTEAQAQQLAASGRMTAALQQSGCRG
jgi:hypothetical protein